MPIIQSIIGSSYPFTPAAPTPITIPGAEGGVSSSSTGLFRRVYSGYFNDDVTWFNTATQISSGTDTTVNLSAFSSVYSVQWTGYFVVPTTGAYVFQTNSDDASYVWFGNNAKSGYTTSNSIVNNGGAHGLSPAFSAPILMSAGDYYPIRIQYGDGGGNDGFNISYDVNVTGYNYISSSDILYNDSTTSTNEGFN
jgi:hypothetical protein